MTQLVDLALRNRTAAITYRKALEDKPTERLVEPYRTSQSESRMIVKCWQASPVVIDGAQWRWFRADHILKVADGGSDFIPRCRVELSLQLINDFVAERDREQLADAVDKYFHFVEEAMADGTFSDEEMVIAKELVMGVPPDRLKVTHAHIFMNVLNELLVDGTLTAKEERYLGTVKRALAELGWCP